MSLRFRKIVFFASLSFFWFWGHQTGAQAPNISSIAPTSGPVSALITIAGSSFGATQGSSTISLNGTAVNVLGWSDTLIAGIVPLGVSSGPFSVTVNGQTADSASFAVTPGTLPPGWSDQDICPDSGVYYTSEIPEGGSGGGQMEITLGSGPGTGATYANNVFNVTGSGQGMGGTADGLSFVYQPLAGDGTIIARVLSVQGQAQAGVVIRETLDGNATEASTFSNSPYFFFYDRPSTGASLAYQGYAYAALPYWVELVRSGNTISSYYSPDGINWAPNGSSQTVTMAQNVYIGLAVSSGSNSSLATATFDNVSVSAPGSGSSAPVITSLSATTGPIGSQVTIFGSGFGGSQNGSVVILNGTPVTINTWGATSISITIPTGATSGPMVVSVAPSMNDSNPVMFEVTSQPLPAPWLDQDVGQVGETGSATYASGVFTVNGSGAGITGTTDGMHFVYQPLPGDGTIVARVVSVQGVAGVMIRETLTGSSTQASTLYQAPYFTFYDRPSTGASLAYQSAAYETLPYWVELVRSGNTISSYYSPDGINWAPNGSSQTVTMAQNVYIGLAVSSGSNSSLATAAFDNVSISAPGFGSPAPIITSLSATTGSIGSQVTIFGSGFGGSQDNSVVILDGTQVTINRWDATSISITIPTGATSGLIVVSVAPSMNDSNPVMFEVTSQPLPTPWLDQDVGQVGETGSATYASGAFTVNGSGAGITGTTDGMHFVYQPLQGDGTIIARVVTLQGVAGVMIRQTLTGSSTQASTLYQVPYFYFCDRASTGASLATQGDVYETLPYWVELVRSGNTISSYYSPDGINWAPNGSSQTVTMAQNVYIGLAVSSQNNSSLATATFDNVSINSASSPSSGSSAPVIASVSPTSGVIGTLVTINGTNFGSPPGSIGVTFNGVTANPTNWNSTTIWVPAPAATAGNAVVTAGGLASNGFPVGTFSGGSSPTITDSISPALNGSGWYNSNVLVTFGCMYGGAPINSCTPPVLVTTEGANQIITGTVTDTAGYSVSTSVSLNIEKTAPSITVSYPTDGSSFTSAGLTVTGSITNSLTPVSSVTCNGASASVSSGAFSCPIEMNPGVNLILVTAVDLAGNLASARMHDSYSVSLPTPSFLQITPNNATVLLGNTQQFTATDQAGRPRPDASWTVSDNTIASISTGGNPMLTGLTAGQVTLTVTVGGTTAQTQVTIISGTSLATGTVIWSAPTISGFSVSQIVQAVPTSNNTPDLFSIETDGNSNVLVRSFSSDGEPLWQTVLPQVGSVIQTMGDGTGGLLLGVEGTSPAVLDLDGQSGASSTVFTSPANPSSGGPTSLGAVGPDGSIYLTGTDPGSLSGAIFKVDANSGQTSEIFAAPLGVATIIANQCEGFLHSGSTAVPGIVTGPVIDANGTVSFGYSSGMSSTYTSTLCLGEPTNAQTTNSETSGLISISSNGSVSNQVTGTSSSACTTDDYPTAIYSCTNSESGGSIGELTPDGQGGVLAMVSPYSTDTSRTMIDTAASSTYPVPLSGYKWVVGENGLGYMTDFNSVAQFNVSTGQIPWTYTPAQGSVGNVLAAEGGGVTVLDGSLNQIPIDSAGNPGAIVSGVGSSPLTLSSWLSKANGIFSVVVGSPYRSSGPWPSFDGDLNKGKASPKLVVATFEARVPGSVPSGVVGTTQNFLDYLQANIPKSSADGPIYVDSTSTTVPHPLATIPNFFKESLKRTDVLGFIGDSNLTRCGATCWESTALIFEDAYLIRTPDCSPTGQLLGLCYDVDVNQQTPNPTCPTGDVQIGNYCFTFLMIPRKGIPATTASTLFTSAKVVFIGACATTPIFTGWWEMNLNAAPGGRALVVPDLVAMAQLPINSTVIPQYLVDVDLELSSIGYVAFINSLGSGDNVQYAVNKANKAIADVYLPSVYAPNPQLPQLVYKVIGNSGLCLTCR
jgi:hypothetical protein